MPENEPSSIKEPPKTFGGILRQLGPGLIIAGAIVGSGELVATTAVGAEAGFILLWLIIIGCLIKVFVQIEFGRYTIITGRTTLSGMNEVSGPRARVNWLLWFWLVFSLVALVQLGGIIGGVGQALTIQQPLTESGRIANQHHEKVIQEKVKASLSRESTGDKDKASSENLTSDPNEDAESEETVSGVGEEIDIDETKEENSAEAPSSHDSLIWCVIVTIISIFLLVIGRYRLIQNFSTVLVTTFTLVTIVNLIYLQSLPDWRVTWEDLKSGMTFQIPEGAGLTVALAAFGIIGVGATELIQYPYWCQEKGYAKWTGPRDDSPEWAARAEGWMKVLRWDAWCSMVVYTSATIAFYLLGAAILNHTGLNPEGDQMVRTLGEMYAPVFGTAAQAIFLFGAFAVLYSTYFVATASHARVSADAMRVFKVIDESEESYRRWVKIFCIIFPLFFLASYAFFRAPKQLVLAGGFMGALILPFLGLAALFFRYKRCDARLAPGRAWDIGLWISCIGMFIAGGYALYSKVVLELLEK